MGGTTLYDAVVGNGRMLVTLGQTGLPERVFWPDIDYAQILDRCNWGVCVEGHEVLWQDNPNWRVNRRYLPGTNDFLTRSISEAFDLVLEAETSVPAEPDALVVRFRISNVGNRDRKLSFLVYAAFNLEESPLFQAAYYLPLTGVLLFYRRRTWVVLGGDRPVSSARCGRRDGDSAWQDAQDGHLQAKEIVDERADGALSWDLGWIPAGGERELTLYMVPGGSREEALTLWEKAKGLRREEGQADWKRWLGQASRLREAPDEVTELYQRSLLTLPLLQNRVTGGIIAAPEFDPQRHGSGGYGYCWPRDAVWVALALDEAGYHQEAGQFYRWTVRYQEPSGAWYQRYWTDGTLAPSWGLIQVDETGAVLWGMAHHFKLTRDADFLRQIWPAVQKGAAFLCSFRDEVTGLPAPSFDLWEERFMETSYGTAAVIAGLRGAAFLAGEMGDGKGAGWRQVAREMREGLESLVWRQEEQRFGRGLYRGQDEQGRVVHHWDGDLDASLLGLVVPFRIFPVRDPRVQRTLERLERGLWSESAGGILRYQKDSYRGGNPWVVTTLWLSLYHFQCGEMEKGRSLLAWVLHHRNGAGLLPEQVDKHHGGPAWVVPLTWSGALAVLACLAGYGENLPRFMQEGYFAG